MALYTKTTNFTTKDSLASGDANKIVKGSEHDTEYNNIQTAFTGVMALDGSQTPTANLPMGGFKLTNIGAATARTDAPQLAQIQDAGTLYLGSIAGTANAITASLTPAITAYAAGQVFRFIPANSNTAAATININSVGAKNIFLNNAALVGYELRKNCPVELLYDGTQFHVVAGAHGGDGIPIGRISDRAFASLPSGHLLCDGSAVSRTTYADLFAVLSTTWGAGDGSTTFNVPSLARRVTVGSGGVGTATLGNTVGSTGGAETHTLTTAEIPAHTHTMANARTLNGGGAGADIANTGGADINTGSTGGGGAHNNMQPSAVVYKVIKF